MKDETKYLIAWIKGVIANCPYIAMPDSIRADSDEKKEDAIKFLDSFPEIESHLCRGGYIQDANGIPCCDGDKILFCGKYNGFLRFGFMDAQEKKYNPIPHFWFDFGGVVPTISGSMYFEKVE